MAGRRALPVRLEWLALVAALAVGVAYDAAVLFKYPFAVGVDGYYYVLQINELRTQGRLYFPTRTPLILYLLTGVSAPAGSTQMPSLVPLVRQSMSIAEGPPRVRPGVRRFR
jgi:hypothetical protein